MADANPKPDDPKFTAQVAGQRPVVRSPHFFDIYCNATKIFVSAADFTVAISRASEIGGINVIEELAFIRMSPQQFKTFVTQMTTMLKAWEDVLGEISQVGASPSYEDVRANIQRMKDAVTHARATRAAATASKQPP
jgi:hypothetical protein